jgi:hypothetical protein
MKHICVQCGDDIDPPQRAQLGYRICLWCGEEAARSERKSWTVVQEYQKGGYMFVTADAAATTLKQTNQKAVRS